jgi:hypothetical protein
MTPRHDERPARSEIVVRRRQQSREAITSSVDDGEPQIHGGVQSLECGVTAKPEGPTGTTSCSSSVQPRAEPVGLLSSCRRLRGKK